MTNILELDITIKGSKPKIWRRVQVPAGITFYELHYVVQFAMGWQNDHLHQFIVGKGEEYIRPPHETDFEELTDSRVTKISEHLAAPNNNIVYEYDFGDSWEHDLVVKKVFEADPNQYYPVLVGGERACPPEDCGGIWGYADLQETLKKPGTKAYKEMVEWLGDVFDPEAFEVKKMNDAYFKNFMEKMKEWDILAPS